MGRPQPAPSAPPDRAVAPLIALVRLSRQVLSELKERLGEPRGFWQRRRFNRERRKLKRRVFGRLPRITSW